MFLVCGTFLPWIQGQEESNKARSYQGCSTLLALPCLGLQISNSNTPPLPTNILMGEPHTHGAPPRGTHCLPHPPPPLSDSSTMWGLPLSLQSEPFPVWAAKNDHLMTQDRPSRAKLWPKMFVVVSILEYLNSKIRLERSHHRILNIRSPTLI